MFRTRWKPHKSKELNFLHGKYIRFFFSSKKKLNKISIENIFRFFFDENIFDIFSDQKSKFTIFDFWSDFSRIFFVEKKIGFFSIENFLIFSELRKCWGYSFDVKNYVLSIYEVFRTIRCPQMRFLAM